MVRLYLEEGYSATVLRDQFGVSGHSVQRWVKAYREQGSDGLIAKLRTQRWIDCQAANRCQAKT
jgi:transposase